MEGLLFILPLLTRTKEIKRYYINLARAIFHGNYTILEFKVKDINKTPISECKGRYGCCIKDDLCFRYIAADDYFIKTAIKLHGAKPTVFAFVCQPREPTAEGPVTFNSTTRICFARSSDDLIWSSKVVWS